ncbi:MAG: hypothetical protein ACREDM_00270 [Methylocella sp.]
MTKDSGIRIRVQRDPQEIFIDVCRVRDRSAAQVLRDFMRNYVNRHESAQAGHLPSRCASTSNGCKGSQVRILSLRPFLNQRLS